MAVYVVVWNIALGQPSCSESNEWIFGEWMQWNWNASTQNIWCVDQTEKNAFY